MNCFVGLDVSLKLTAICVVHREGNIVREGVADTQPDKIPVSPRFDTAKTLGGRPINSQYDGLNPFADPRHKLSSRSSGPQDELVCMLDT
jgi:hypothetical protein